MMSYTESGFLPCRHRRGEDTPYPQCTSTKLVGLRTITEKVCRDCYCRDHEDTSAPAFPCGRMRGCAYLGSAVPDEPGVYSCLHPGHERTNLVDCQACPDYLFPILTPQSTATDVRRHIDLPPRPQPAGWWDWACVQDAYAGAATEFIRDLPKYPAGRYQGRGVVIVGGGKYFPSVYVTVRALRYVGSQLPISVYYFGHRDELPTAYQSLLLPYGVTCVDLDDTATDFAYPARALPTDPTERGWAAKAQAILDARFEEVLFLDADCYPCRSPDALFESSEYRATGAVFWHDDAYDPRLRWDAFRLRPTGRSSIEAGQLLVNKSKCWAALRLGWWYAAHREVSFRWGYGDKHACFEVPWARLQLPYTSFAELGAWSGQAFRHVGPDQKPLFIHRCRDKFRFPDTGGWLSPQNFETNNFRSDCPLEEQAFAWMSELCRMLRINGGVLKLACGNRPLLGGHNHDFQRHASFVDTAHDLNTLPWPWPAGTFDRVFAEDALERIVDLTVFMNEVHRVLKPGGRLLLRP